MEFEQIYNIYLSRYIAIFGNFLVMNILQRKLQVKLF